MNEVAPTPFGQELQAFLNQPELICMTPRLSWVAGGCLILTKALVLWSEQQLKEGCFKRELEDVVFMDHAFAFWTEAGKPTRLVDGEGVHSEAELALRLDARKACPTRQIQWRPAGGLALGVINNTRLSKAVAKRLLAEFGPFNAEVLY